MSIFDSMAHVAVNITNDAFGFSATWGEYTAAVKYKDLEGAETVGDKKIGLEKWLIEIKDSDFPGLKTAINQNKKEPISVTVRGDVIEFVGVTAVAISDGMCTEIRLKKKGVINTAYSPD